MVFKLLNDFLQTSIEERIEVLYLYLVKGESSGFIAENYYKNKNYAWKISAITQGYSEYRGKNRGKVATTKENIKKFIEAYPKGTYDKGLTLSDWIESSAHIDPTEQQNKTIFASEAAIKSAESILKYIYSQGLGFRSEYKYSIALHEQFDNYSSSQSIDYFVAIFEDYFVYILGDVQKSSIDMLIPFKEIKGFEKNQGGSILNIDIIYKGAYKVYTDFEKNYRVTLPFINHKNENSDKLFNLLTSQYEMWKFQGERNFSSQLPIIRRQLGSGARRYIANVLELFLVEGMSVSDITKAKFSQENWKNGLRAIVKLLSFDFRLKLSDCGKLSKNNLTITDFERFVEHFKNGLRVDKKELSSDSPQQFGLNAIERFFRK